VSEQQTIPNPNNQPVVDAPKRGNGIGVASLVVGIVAFVFAIIPVVSFIAWFIALVAVGLGITGLVLKNRKRGTAIAGLILGVVAFIAAIVVSISTVAGVGQAISDAAETAQAEAPAAAQPDADAEATDAPAAEAPAAGSTLVYEVSGEGASASTVSYATVQGGQYGQEQATDAPLPWSKEFTVDNGAFDFGVFSLTAQAAQGTTSISCRITLDGEVVAEQTSTGEYSVVSCSGTNQ
jgi:hypothetical protein